MNAAACTSKWQCTVIGLSGTAVALSIMVLLWVGAQMLRTGVTGGAVVRVIWLWTVPFGPVLMSVLYAALMRWQARPMGWFGIAATIGGAIWGVTMLNVMRHL